MLVDVGTGYYVEKKTADAMEFYKGKVEAIGKNLKDLDAVMQQKSGNLRMVEEGEFMGCAVGERGFADCGGSFGAEGAGESGAEAGCVEGGPRRGGRGGRRSIYPKNLSPTIVPGHLCAHHLPEVVGMGCP